MDTNSLLQNYDLNNLTIGTLGGHSALDICRGAKAEGLRSLVVAVRGRERTYAEHYKTRDNLGCVDECLVVEKFTDILKPEIQNRLRELNTIFIHSRYFWVYFGKDDFQKIECEFEVPIFGTRELLKMEERDIAPNQYDMLREAKIRLPKIFAGSREIDRLTITKINNAVRTYERENFFASSAEEWHEIAEKKIRSGAITREALQKCVIEEFILGAQVNFNFFYSPLAKRLELMGTDTRRQTNLDGWLRLPANEQLKLSEAGIAPAHIETGHIAVTVKESLLEKAFDAGERFIKACEKYHPRGIIGPFALQGAIDTDGKKEELIVFDVSLRIPGSPGIGATPYANYLFGENISMGRRIAREIKKAVSEKKLEEVLT